MGTPVPGATTYSLSRAEASRIPDRSGDGRLFSGSPFRLSRLHASSRRDHDLQASLWSLGLCCETSRRHEGGADGQQLVINRSWARAGRLRPYPTRLIAGYALARLE